MRVCYFTGNVQEIIFFLFFTDDIQMAGKTTGCEVFGVSRPPEQRECVLTWVWKMSQSPMEVWSGLVRLESDPSMSPMWGKYSSAHAQRPCSSPSWFCKARCITADVRQTTVSKHTTDLDQEISPVCQIKQPTMRQVEQSINRNWEEVCVCGVSACPAWIGDRLCTRVR